MQANVFLQKISWLCCRSWDRHSVGHSNVNPLFKEWRPTGLSELSLFFSCCVPLHHDWLKSTFICKFLLTMDLVKGVTQFCSKQAKLPRYDPQELTGIPALPQMMPQGCTTPISELRIQTFSSPWLISSGPGTHLSGRSMEAAAMQWTRAVHIDLVHIFQSLPVYCNHLVSCGNTSGQASECL